MTNDTPMSGATEGFERGVTPLHNQSNVSHGGAIGHNGDSGGGGGSGVGGGGGGGFIPWQESPSFHAESGVPPPNAKYHAHHRNYQVRVGVRLRG